MKDRGSHRPSGSFADFTTKPVNRVVAHCVKCGCGLDRKKKFCLPCSVERAQETHLVARYNYRKKHETLSSQKKKKWRIGDKIDRRPRKHVVPWRRKRDTVGDKGEHHG